MTLAELKADVVILACAISAGIHGALAPDHFSEGAGAGLGFVASAVALAGLAMWMTAGAQSPLALAAAAAVFVGLLASYAVAVTSGLPLLHPEPEPIDGLALATKAIEAVGLATALSLLWRPAAAVDSNRTEPDMNTTQTARPIPLALTALVAFFSALAALAVSNGHDALANGNEPHQATRGGHRQAVR